MRFAFIFISIFVAGPLVAQHSHSPASHAMSEPQETGQSAFAAVAEIVSLLRADTDTNWALVDIAGLRRHLVDMDLVTMQANVVRVLQEDGVRFEVRGTSRVLEAVQAMVPAHAPFLAAETGWNVHTETLEDGVALVVVGDTSMIQGLGFFGLMSIGAHHQQHHLMMARGKTAHH